MANADAGPGNSISVLRRAHGRAAATLDSEGFLHREARQRLLDRLQWISMQPSLVIDLGSGTGAALAALSSRFPGATLLAADHARAMLSAARRRDRLPSQARMVCAAAERLPLADASADLVWSNLMLAYCPDPRPVIAEARRVLRARGLFSFTTLGRGSFAELGEAWAQADDFVHVAAQPDMHDLGDLLVRGGFSEPVLDTEVVTVTYTSLADLARDLRSVAAINRSSRRNPGLTGRGVAKRLRAALEKRRDPSGRFAITIELIFAQAWVGAEQPAAGRDDIEVPLSAIVRRRIGPDHSN